MTAAIRRVAHAVLASRPVHLRSWQAAQLGEAQLDAPDAPPDATLVADSARPDLPLDAGDAALLADAADDRSTLLSTLTEG